MTTYHLDCAATCLPRRPEALAAAREAASWPTPGRGRHGAQAAAAERVEAARRAVGALVAGEYVVCFTAGATAALNQAIAGLRPPARRVALGPLVHNSARRPALALGVPVWTLACDALGIVDVEATAAAWEPDTDLVVISHGSNVTGAIQPVEAVVALAKARGARVVVDASQTAGSLVPLRVGPADMIAFSAHKGLAALPGVGALLVAPDLRLEPLIRGGVGFDGAEDDVPDELPARLESGTPNLPGIAAMGAAAEACLRSPWDWRAAGDRLRRAIRDADVATIGDGPLPVASLQTPGIAPREIEEILDRVYGITTRAGLHCAFAAHRTLGTAAAGTLRLSVGIGTPEEAFGALTRALREIGPAIIGGAGGSV